MKLSDFDKNLKVETTLNANNIKFYDIRLAPFKIYGLYKPLDEPVFTRMPKDVAVKVSEGVNYLHTNTAGGRVRFKTNSSYVAIIAKMPHVERLGHMALCGSSGFDLYVENRFLRAFVPPSDMKTGYESIQYFYDGSKMRDITINFPLYNNLDSLYIGLDSESEIEETPGYINKKPVVFYGSSITQGACASRPGSSYQNIISTDYNIDYVNLGFSGNAKAEPEMIDYLCNLPASVFVCDYDHNAPTLEHLEQTHEKLYKAYRAKNKDVPVIFISKPDFDSLEADNTLRRAVIMKTYLNALNSGDKNVYFIDGETFYGQYRRDMYSVDGCHPNDAGFLRMAKVIGKVLEKALHSINIL